MSKEIDWVGQQALNILTKNHGPHYSAQKAHGFDNSDRVQCLAALNSFDQNDIMDLAALLKTTPCDLRLQIGYAQIFID